MKDLLKSLVLVTHSISDYHAPSNLFRRDMLTKHYSLAAQGITAECILKDRILGLVLHKALMHCRLSAWKLWTMLFSQVFDTYVARPVLHHSENGTFIEFGELVLR